MSSAAAHLHSADPADQQAGDAQYYRLVLHELIDMGVDLARAVHQDATSRAGPAITPVHDPADAFDLISRAIRRTIALARKVAEPLPARVSGAGHNRVAARRRIIREVEDVIQRTYDVDEEALQAELSERMDALELEDEIDDRLVEEIIVDICRDLGIAETLGAHPWKRRMPRDIEALCAHAAQPSGAPSPMIDHAAPGGADAGAGPPSPPRDAAADLLRFTFPVRGT